MQYGVVLPNAGLGGDPHLLADLAALAESTGWDGVFLWDTPILSFGSPEEQTICDAWVALAAMAMRTERVRLGTMLTPLAWHRPWLIARQAATLDHLSRGRFILATGLGYVPPEGQPFGEEGDRRTRAAMLDEALAIITGLWSGEPFAFDGEHFHLAEVTFQPRPAQQPRIPIWVVGAWPADATRWPRKKSMRRTLRYDGLLPNYIDETGAATGQMTAADLRPMAEWVAAERTGTAPFDIVSEGSTEGMAPQDAAAETGRWAEAGATWWLESVWTSMHETPGDATRIRERISAGPPRGRVKGED